MSEEIDFSKLSLAELTKLKDQADAAMKIVADAVQLKERSKGVLTTFAQRINGVMKSPFKLRQEKVQRSYGSSTEPKVELLSQGPLSDAFRVVLNDLMSHYSPPFGLVPMEKFWAEWGDGVDKLTKLMVNRYLAKYVTPYPTDTAENVLAVKVGETIAEAATPVEPAPEVDIPF